MSGGVICAFTAPSPGPTTVPLDGQRSIRDTPEMRSTIRRPAACVFFNFIVLSIATNSGAQHTSPSTEPPTVPNTAPVQNELTGREIYEAYVKSRAHESFQKIRILSRDPGGSEQLSVFDLSVQDARDEDGNPTRGVRFRSRMDVHDPFDMRHTKYLIITKERGETDEFVYQPSARRVRRVDLTETSFLGTDFTFGDLTVPNTDDAEHLRLPDEVIDGRSVYVVESKIKDGVETPYPKSIVYLEKEHYVPLRTRSWDTSDTEVKELTAKADTIHGFDDVWLATQSTMRDLKNATSSTLFVDELDPKPKFNRGVFSSGHLARGK